uniref:Uncharacterized protein n=1 Tax=Chromera velia CCMP2878 TaxID=1169474 RepID=A0A0G4FRQ6_9ALVE|eukprot:Cvel_18433.t1-p1 / transcript=Cvel_18433.t1 / gene=Cvel_18433 / organism=Chromera_velia_CCMP2878 / gene_product=hypothetical protein / transcript_product=hypothetical protein / location=Cvel_scaffold1526:39097-40914(+) / protein_length=247 / sequence_SO=supercontig / SO=protein_coding / is_pseudo=false
MLSLYKNQVVTQVSKQNFAVRQKELEWFENNFWTIAQQATIIAGFSFTQLTTQVPSGIPVWMEVIYSLLVSASLSAQIYVICVCMYAYIWAQTRAVMGNRGFKDINRSLKEMHKEQTKILAWFIFGLFLFLLSAFFVLFIFDEPDAQPASITLVVIVVLTFLYFPILVWRFYYKRTRKSGLDAVEGAYDRVGDLDFSSERRRRHERSMGPRDRERERALGQIREEEGGEGGQSFFQSMRHTFMSNFQ